MRQKHSIIQRKTQISCTRYAGEALPVLLQDCEAQRVKRADCDLFGYFSDGVHNALLKLSSRVCGKCDHQHALCRHTLHAWHDF
jgi:hypothetical protein